MANHKANLTSGPIGKTLFWLTLPMVWGLLAVISFNLADTFFLARLGVEELAAISFTFPVVMVVMSGALGLGTGAASVIARAIGRGDHSQVQRLTTDSLLLALSIVLIVATLGWFSIDPLFRILGAKGEILLLTRAYMEIWFLGIPCLVIPMVGNSAIRAAGDTKIPGALMCLAAGLNVALDPILIFGLLGFPALGIRGAAIATVISYFTTLIASLCVLRFKKDMLTFHLNLKEMLRSWREILHMALAAATANLSAPLLNGFALWLLSDFGAAVVGGYGVASRVESFTMIVIMALGSAFGPFAGQNWGAGRFDRLAESLKKVFRFGMLWGVGIAILLWFFANQIPALFRENENVIETSSLYFRTVPISYGLMSLSFLGQAFFNATGHAFLAYMTGVGRLLLFALLAMLGKSWFGMEGVFGALFIANLVIGTGSYFYSKKVIHHNSI